jgi:hypothetical protein
MYSSRERDEQETQESTDTEEKAEHSLRQPDIRAKGAE